MCSTSEVVAQHQRPAGDSRHSTITKPVQFEDGATCKECNIELWTEAKAIGTKKRKRHFDMHGLVAVSFAHRW